MIPEPWSIIIALWGVIALIVIGAALGGHKSNDDDQEPPYLGY